MNETTPEPRRGGKLLGADGRRIGVIDAVFADYLLVRTAGLLPVDLYVPRPDVTLDAHGQASVSLGADEAYQAWHRPLKRVTHGPG